MFCEKCGKPIGADQTVCDECAAKQQENAAAGQEEQSAFELPLQETQPVIPQAEQAPTKTPEVPQDSIVLEQDFGQPKNKKKRTGLALGIVAAVLAVAVLAVVLCWGSLKGLWLKNFGDPTDYMRYVEENALSQSVDKISASYGSSLSQLSELAPVGGDTEMRLILGDMLITMAEQALANEGIETDLSFLEDISVKLHTAAEGDLNEVKLSLGLGDTDVAQVQVFLDADNNRLILGVPDYLDGYVSIDMPAEMQTVDFSQMTELFGKLPDADLVSKVIDKYMGVVLSHLDDAQKDSETMEVEDVKQKLTTLTVKFTEKDLLELLIDIVETAEKDKNLKELLDCCSDYFNSFAQQVGGYTYEEIDLYEMLMAELPDALEYLEEEKEYGEFSKSNYIELTDYINNDHELCGRTIKIASEGIITPIKFHYLTVQKGNTYGEEIRLNAEGANLLISGSYEEDDGVRNGSYDLSVNGIKALTLETIDCTDTQLKLKLTPAGDLWDQVLSSGLSSTVLDLAAPALEISIKATDQESNSELYLTAGGEKLVGIIAKFSANDASVELPSGNYLDGSDPDVMYEWGASFDFEALINKLTEAGVPQTLLDELLAMLVMYAQ